MAVATHQQARGGRKSPPPPPVKRGRGRPRKHPRPSPAAKTKRVEVDDDDLIGSPPPRPSPAGKGGDGRTLTVGHNNPPPDSGIAGDQLRSFIERIERLMEDKANVQEDIKEVFQEAKATGFDPGIMRMVLARRKQDAAEIQEREAILEVYLHALGMVH